MMNKEMKMSVEDLINYVVDQDFSKAAPTFAEIMRDRMSDTLEQEKIGIADQVFNDVESEEDEFVEDDPDDEDIDAALADDAEEYADDDEE